MELIKLSEHLWVYKGYLNIGILTEGSRCLLLDFADSILDGPLKTIGVQSVESILLTHHHRDQAVGIRRAIDKGASVAAPEAERQWLETPENFWNDPKYRWHIYNFHPGRLMPIESIPITRGLKSGDKIEWGSAVIRVLGTPGHTDGSLSYIVEVDGHCTAFTGDVIYGPGQVWDVHSLQKGLTTTDYHGFMGVRNELTASLETILETEPETLIPAHGLVMNEPKSAIDLLKKRLDECYRTYSAVSALHHYFPGMLTSKAVMPKAVSQEPPVCLKHIGTTWILISESGAAFVMDCGNGAIVGELECMFDKGEITSVEGIWITHYHDDHVDGIAEFQKTFGCELYADGSVADVITSPKSWKLPCISPIKARVDKVTTDGTSWQWREFRMTAYHLPGQSLYHGGLLVEGQDTRMFFVGDSFTPTGIDDYCPQNRNLLGDNAGFRRCISLIRETRPDYILNPHVDEAFNFDTEQLDIMDLNLKDREAVFRRLMPWDDANYGIDDSWAYCFPYEQSARPDKAVTIDAVVTNHSAEDRKVFCKAHLPAQWPAVCVEPSAYADISPKDQAKIPLEIPIPRGTAPGRYPIIIDIDLQGIFLPSFIEAIIEIEA